MKIKEFSIDNLYYEYDFSSSLDEKVNIFVGNNGSFKTTLLRLLRHAVACEKNGQFFQSHLTKLTTHSPSIFSDGWGEKAIYMEDITTKKI